MYRNALLHVVFPFRPPMIFCWFHLGSDTTESVHSHYFGGGFERVVGKKLRQFVAEHFEYDDKAGRVKAPAKVLNALRRIETRDLLHEEREYAKRVKVQMAGRDEEQKIVPPSLASSEAMLERSQREQDMLEGKRPRYASTKMTADECDEGTGFGKGGGGKGFGF